MKHQHIDDPQRIAEAGHCACEAKIVRGFDNTGELITVNAPLVDAATELIAHTTGTRSYQMRYQTKRPRGLVLTARTRLDIKRRPPGFHTHISVVIEHDCTDRKGTP